MPRRRLTNLPEIRYLMAANLVVWVLTGIEWALKGFR